MNTYKDQVAVFIITFSITVLVIHPVLGMNESVIDECYSIICMSILCMR